MATLQVNRDGFAIGDYKELGDAEPLKVKTGAWIAHMHYKDKGFEQEPMEVTIMNATALLHPRVKWELADEDIYSESQVIAVWDWQTANRKLNEGNYAKSWQERTRLVLSDRDYSEFSNYMLFQVKKSDEESFGFYKMELFKGKDGEVLGIRITLKEEAK